MVITSSIDQIVLMYDVLLLEIIFDVSA